MPIIEEYTLSPFKNLPAKPRPVSPRVPDNVPRTRFYSPNTEFTFGENSIKKLWIKNFNSIYNRYSNRDENHRLGFDQPFIEVKPNDPAAIRHIKRYDTRALPIGSAIQDALRISKFLLTPKGVMFVATQTFLQTLNPTLETKVYNPLSLGSIAPYVNIDRHASLGGGVTSLLNTISGGLFDKARGAFGTRNYSEAVQQLPYTGDNPRLYGRTINQSPLMNSSLTSQELPGIKYASKARDIMANPAMFKNINPNRYLFPLSADGSGLPFISRPSPGEELESNINLAKLGVRYTKSGGFNLPSRDTTSFRDTITGLLTNLIPSTVRRPIARILGLANITPSTPLNIYNKYNPSFKYALYQSQHVVRTTTESDDGIVTWESGKSPLIDILSGLSVVGEAKASQRTPFTFLNEAEIENIAGVVVDERTQIDPYSDGLKKVKRYLQTYGKIKAKRRSAEEGSANISSIPDVGATEQTYEQRKLEDGSPIVYVNYGFDNAGSKQAQSRYIDRINALDYGEDYEQAIGGVVRDTIPFKFYHINTGKWIIFRATISGINESVSPEWNSKKYIGRADKFYTYSGAERSLSFSFKVAINSPKEMAPIWRKLNYLTGLCYPNYVPAGNAGSYMVAPFVRLTIGDLYNDLPGIMQSLNFTIPDDINWEIRDTETDPQGNQISMLPHVIDISVGFNIIGRQLYSSTSKFFDAHFIN